MSSALVAPHPRPATPRAPLVALALALASMTPFVSPALALVAGAVLALTFGDPFSGRSRELARVGLAWSVVGLGAGADLAVVGRVGARGLGYTAIGVAAALAVGALLGRRLRVGRDVSLLISVGTAICGGSAIAAVAPALRAKGDDVSMALVTVFLFNGLALVVFPFVGYRLHLDQESFGLWCALAIHDTSSVVGAAGQFGDHALAVATAAKLARALWVVPVAAAVAASRPTQNPTPDARGRRPWFIAGFVLASALVTFVPALADAGKAVARLAHHAFALTLFLMGLGLSRPALRALGWRPLLLGASLWALLASATLAAILVRWVT